MNETESLMVLNAVKGLSNAKIRQLLGRYGCAANVLALSESDLLSDLPALAPVIQNIVHFPAAQFLQAEYQLMQKRRVSVVTFADEHYPKPLRDIADAPVVLYVKGALPSEKSLSVAIVGSRKASFYGIATAQRFARELSGLGFTIVSGLARGIDAAAHTGALSANGPTIAVCGCGLDFVYPLDHKDLSDRIAESGAVISEFPMRTAPLPFNFPRRNRIISGLSHGVIVVEAAKKSGALITADFALEQGREVFAVPGKIDQVSSAGVHRLIQQGAKLVTSLEDILEDLQTPIADHLKEETSGVNRLKPPAGRAARNRETSLSEEEQVIFDHISDRPVHIDDLTRSCDKTIPVMSILLQLELKQLIKQLPGKLFVR